jgi:single-strand DNA-binding protein
MNLAIITGRLTKNPELRYLPGTGKAVARFGVAVDKGLSKEKKQELKAQGKPTADFINVIVWGKQAENCANYIEKGRKIGIEGSIRTGSYTDSQGKKVYTTEVVATKVEFLDYKNANTNQSYSNQIPEGFEPIDDDDIPF